MTEDKQTADIQTEVLSDDALDDVQAGARTPAHTPEFKDLRTGDPGRTLSRAVSTWNLTLKRG